MCVCVCFVCGAVSRACAEVTIDGEARVDSRALFQASDVTRELEAENARGGEEGRKWMDENGSTQK